MPINQILLGDGIATGDLWFGPEYGQIQNKVFLLKFIAIYKMGVDLKYNVVLESQETDLSDGALDFFPRG